MSPQPKPLHQQIAENVQRALSAALAGTLYVAKQNTNIKLPDAYSMPAPNVLVVAEQPWQQVCQADDYLSGPPALVVEVVSPSNRRARVEEKVRVYLEATVPQIWIVQPKKQTVWIYQQDHPEGILAVGNVELITPLEGFVSIENLFRLHR